MPTNTGVVGRLERFERGLKLGLVLRLLLEVEAEDDVPAVVEDHLALVQLGHRAEKVERTDVPHLTR